MPDTQTAISLRDDQWTTVALCLDEWSNALKSGASGRLERIAFKLAKASIDEVAAEIRRARTEAVA